MKPAILVFFEKDPLSAKELAQSLRTGSNSVGVREAKHHLGEEREECERVLVLSNVTPRSRQEIHRLYGSRVEDVPIAESSVQPVTVAPVEEVTPVERSRKARRVTAVS